MRASQAAAVLGMSPENIRAWCRHGYLRHTVLNGRYRVDADDVAEHAQARAAGWYTSDQRARRRL